MRIVGLLIVAAFAATSCRLIERLSRAPVLPRNREPPLPGPPTYSHYLHETWQWRDVNRVLVLPPRNESQYTRAGEEFHRNLTAELQRLGLFEVVSAPADPEGQLARLIHVTGRFDEGAILDLGKATRADVIVFPTITQYSPYPRPRLGVVLQAVAPLEGKVIASVDGMWDTTDASIAENVRTFYRQRPKPLPRRVRNHEIATEDAFAEELSLDSPALFQRWVSQVSSRVLVGLPADGGVPMQADRPLVLPRWKPGAIRQALGTATGTGTGIGTVPCNGCEPTATPAGSGPVSQPLPGVAPTRMPNGELAPVSPPTPPSSPGPRTTGPALAMPPVPSEPLPRPNRAIPETGEKQ